MKTIVISDEGRKELVQIDFASEQGLNEAWIQDALFSSPALLNVQPQDSRDQIIPLCRELPLRSVSSTVFLDLFAVRTSGRPVLIECKLWRNPQARREVVGQILEYAALIHKKKFSELEALVKEKRGRQWRGIWAEVSEVSHANLDEADFADNFTNCLESGQFDLIIAGDGIRSDVHAIVKLLEQTTIRSASLSLLEVNVWRHGEEFVVTAAAPIQYQEVAYRSNSVTQYAVPRIELPSNQISSTGKGAEKRQANRKFWDRFISTIRFDHPDQELPRHGGNNAVRVPFLAPAKWITCYRVSSGRSRIGIFMSIYGADGQQLFQSLMEREEELSEKIPGIDFDTADWNDMPQLYVNREVDIADQTTEPEQLEWLSNTLNTWVNVFRPIFADFTEE